MFFSSLNQCYDMIICVYWLELFSQVSDVAHGPLVYKFYWLYTVNRLSYEFTNCQQQQKPKKSIQSCIKQTFTFSHFMVCMTICVYQKYMIVYTLACPHAWVYPRCKTVTRTLPPPTIELTVPWFYLGGGGLTYRSTQTIIE